MFPEAQLNVYLTTHIMHHQKYPTIQHGLVIAFTRNSVNYEKSYWFDLYIAVYFTVTRFVCSFLVIYCYTVSLESLWVLIIKLLWLCRREMKSFLKFLS